MKYKIGEVSKILNIPLETIRYYESKNIVHPSKDNLNNYRYYDAWDINFLIECKKFRSFDFSLSEVQDILHKDNLCSFTDKIEERQKYFNEKLKYFTLLSQKNNSYINSLKNIKGNLNKFIVTEHPEIYYFIHRYNYKYDSKEKMDGLFEIWLDFFPFVDIIVEMKKESVLNRQNNNDYSWGFSLKKEYVEEFNIPINEKVTHIENIKCVYTVICAGEKGSFSLKLLDKALEFIEKEGYELAGNVTGNLLARTHEENGYSRFIEVWLPIK